MHDALQSAFRAAFADLCRHGLCKWDEQVLDRLWLQFKVDAASGFASLFDDFEEERS